MSGLWERQGGQRVSGGANVRVPASPAGSWRSARPLSPCLRAPASCWPSPPRSYHGEAHVGLLECRPAIGAVPPGHGHHLPLARVRAVDDACGRVGVCSGPPGTSWGWGPRLAQSPLWPLPRHPPDLKLHPSSQHLQGTRGPLAQCWLQPTPLRRGLLPLPRPLALCSPWPQQ